MGSFDHRRYSGLNLLGKRISWTTYLNGADCGCNAAVYLVSLPQNPEVSDCKAAWKAYTISLGSF